MDFFKLKLYYSRTKKVAEDDRQSSCAFKSEIIPLKSINSIELIQIHAHLSEIRTKSAMPFILFKMQKIRERYSSPH